MACSGGDTPAIFLACGLDIHSLADGIQTAEQWCYLRDLGCRFGQGDYFSRPVPESKIAKMLNHRWALEDSPPI